MSKKTKLFFVRIGWKTWRFETAAEAQVFANQHFNRTGDSLPVERESVS